MSFTVREFKELLNLLPEEIQDYRVDICTDLIDRGNDKYEPICDSVWQIQIKKNKWPLLNNTIIIHGDCTCECSENCIYPVVDEDVTPIFIE